MPDARMDGWMDGWMVGWMDGWPVILKEPAPYGCCCHCQLCGQVISDQEEGKALRVQGLMGIAEDADASMMEVRLARLWGPCAANNTRVEQQAKSEQLLLLMPHTMMSTADGLKNASKNTTWLT
jgi:hypothetical protein